MSSGLLGGSASLSVVAAVRRWEMQSLLRGACQGMGTTEHSPSVCLWVFLFGLLWCQTKDFLMLVMRDTSSRVLQTQMQVFKRHERSCEDCQEISYPEPWLFSSLLILCRCLLGSSSISSLGSSTASSMVHSPSCNRDTQLSSKPTPLYAAAAQERGLLSKIEEVRDCWAGWRCSVLFCSLCSFG